MRRTMFEETFPDGTRYNRIEADDFDELRGLRVNGRGRITGYTPAVGELHPCLVHIEGGEDVTADELPYLKFDGRHTEIPI